MEIDSIKLLEKWDGKEYLLLHSIIGFNFTSKRFTQGIVTNEFALLFNDNEELDNEFFEEILNLLKLVAKRKKFKKEQEEKVEKPISDNNKSLRS